MKMNQDAEFCIKMKKALNNKKHHYKQWFLKHFENKKNTLLFKKKLWILENDEIRLNILREIHDQFIIEHSRIWRTLIIIKKHFFWLQMRETVKRYIRNYHVCKRSKASRNKYFELLMSFFISNRFWTNIFMNFVIELFLTRDKLYNVILMIVCRLSKMHHYVACFNEDKNTSAEETTKMLLNKVWKLHELLITIVFD